MGLEINSKKPVGQEPGARNLGVGNPGAKRLRAENLEARILRARNLGLETWDKVNLIQGSWQLEAREFELHNMDARIPDII